MSSMSGYITYIEYQYANAKGATQPDAEGNMPLISNPFGFGKVDADFTGSRVVEAVTGGSTGKVAWGPVVPTMMNHKKDGTCEAVNLFKFLDDKGVEVAGGTLDKDGNYTAPEGATKIAYVYDNVVIPQNNLPMVKAEMKSIALVAKARRIAVKKYAA